VSGSWAGGAACAANGNIETMNKPKMMSSSLGSGERGAESGKRKAESGKRRAESEERKIFNWSPVFVGVLVVWAWMGTGRLCS
jgi:surface antigen